MSSDLPAGRATEIAECLNALLADVFALYFKTKNFHWHVSGSHFREYHELLDEQARELFAMTDTLAERVRKLGERTLTSLGAAHRLQRVADSDSPDVDARGMLLALANDSREMTRHLRRAHELCGECGDYATASHIENWLDESEKRAWFLNETTRQQLGP